jgi:Xaa-Pro aminopeptidase
MVFTIEPGLYVDPDDQSAPPELRGVGIRIEDDILVTERGNENLTVAIPRTVAEVERASARG